MSDLKSAPPKQCADQISLRLISYYFLVQNAWISEFELQSLENKYRICEMVTFEIGYRQNLLRVENWYLFNPKCPYLGILTQNPRKSVSDLK